MKKNEKGESKIEEKLHKKRGYKLKKLISREKNNLKRIKSFQKKGRVYILVTSCSIFRFKSVTPVTIVQTHVHINNLNKVFLSVI